MFINLDQLLVIIFLKLIRVLFQEGYMHLLACPGNVKINFRNLDELTDKQNLIKVENYIKCHNVASVNRIILKARQKSSMKSLG